MPSSILNSDDGVISGTSGLKSSGGDDGALAIQSNGTEVAKFKTTELVINDGGANYDFRVEGDTNANLLFVDASTDRVGLGTNTPAERLDVAGNANIGNAAISGATVNIIANTASQIYGYLGATLTGTFGYVDATQMIVGSQTNIPYIMRTNGTERARITSGGLVLIGKTSDDLTLAGQRFNDSYASFTSNDIPIYVNRQANDGVLIQFRQANNDEGNISVSGSTVSYNGGHLSRWAQLTTPKDDTPLFKGTVMSNLDEMNVYVDADGNDVQNEQLNKVKVSDVEGDANVAGVFVNWTYDEAHQVDEINMAMTGDMIIRIAEGVTVARGDLLMSAGDGTAKPQGDDIVRSKTIAKVTSTHVTCTYDDGSYCVPCVLMAC